VLDNEKKTIPNLTPQQAHDLIEQGVIAGGMIPKIEAALRALEGSQRVLILDGRPPNALYEAVVQSHVIGTTLTQE
jgi:acetylglutamate kinase